MLGKTASSRKNVISNYGGSVNSSGYVVYSTTLTKDTNFKITGYIKSSNANTRAYVRVFINGYGNNDEDRLFMTKSTSDEYFELTPTINSGDTVQIKFIGGDSYNYAIYSSVYVATAETQKTNVIPITPSSITSIGNVGAGFIFGMQDGVFKGGFMLSKETSATTGSITLGNAVGYIKVNLNGEIVKIPYYNE